MEEEEEMQMTEAAWEGKMGSMKKLTVLALVIFQCANSSASVLLWSHQMLRKIKYFAWNLCISEWLR